MFNNNPRGLEPLRIPAESTSTVRPSFTFARTFTFTPGSGFGVYTSTHQRLSRLKVRHGEKQSDRTLPVRIGPDTEAIEPRNQESGSLEPRNQEPMTHYESPHRKRSERSVAEPEVRHDE